MSIKHLDDLCDFLFRGYCRSPYACKTGRHERQPKAKSLEGTQGLTQEALARKVGRSQSWVCALECGHVCPTDLDIALICRALRVRPEVLFPQEEVPTADPLEDMQQ
ncbi:MAG: helix-turn-helix transcriptional regulator [Acidobacteriota bacterium]